VTAISGGAISLGLVPAPIYEVGWTTPILLSGYIGTGSVSGAVLQLVCLGVSFLCYSPFVRMAKRAAENRRKEEFGNLTRELNYYETRRTRRVLNRGDETGAVARILAEQINKAISAEEDRLHLEYQPKTNAEG
jgi:hypothetical protein